MNIFTFTGILATSVSTVGLIVVSAKWGIKDVIDEYTGKGRATAIAKMEAQRDAITGSQTTGLIQKYSAVDNFASQELRNYSRSTSDLTLSSLGSSAKIDKNAPVETARGIVSNQPNQLEVEMPSLKSTEELLRADLPEMNYNVSTDVSEGTSLMENNEETSVLVEDSGDFGSADETSFLGEFDGDGDAFLNNLFSGTDVHETSILEVEDDDTGELTEPISEATASDFRETVTANRFVVTSVYNNIEL